MKNLPTFHQIGEIRYRLHARVFDLGRIALLVGVRPSVVKRIAGTTPTLTNLPLPNPKKQLAEFLKHIMETA